MRSDTERLKDIDEAIAKIEKYTVRGKQNFLDDELVQTWVLFNLQTIGEAVRSISEDIRRRYSQVSWQDIIDFRNLVVHEYFRVDLDLVWLIVENELPSLKSQIKLMLEEIV
ncbi:MAG: DUF86 domain-containing protein [Microcoleus anatoxicus]|uniref:HepT-like ribonuclease domain-containing protein n=1 Tax=Microcoleus anatoxicus TaxID=2705319 RepID=UPI003671489D